MFSCFMLLDFFCFWPVCKVKLLLLLKTLSGWLPETLVQWMLMQATYSTEFSLNGAICRNFSWQHSTFRFLHIAPFHLLKLHIYRSSWFGAFWDLLYFTLMSYKSTDSLCTAARLSIPHTQIWSNNLSLNLCDF